MNTRALTLIIRDPINAYSINRCVINVIAIHLWRQWNGDIQTVRIGLPSISLDHLQQSDGSGGGGDGAKTQKCMEEINYFRNSNNKVIKIKLCRNENIFNSMNWKNEKVRKGNEWGIGTVMTMEIRDMNLWYTTLETVCQCRSNSSKT